MAQGSNGDVQILNQLTTEWAAAEMRGDVSFLDKTLANDFIGIGPRGFMLTKAEWLQRLRSGDLKYTSHELDERQVRTYGGAAIETGRLTQTGNYQNQDIQAQFRATLVWVNQQGRWQLAGLQLSPIAGRP